MREQRIARQGVAALALATALLIQNGQANIAPLTNIGPSNLSVALEHDGFIAGQDSVSP